MSVQSIPLATLDAGTLHEVASRSRNRRARKSTHAITVLAQVVATMFVASIIGLVMTVPSDGTQALSGPALISGAVGMLSAVAGLALGYAKAVQVADQDHVPGSSAAAVDSLRTKGPPKGLRSATSAHSIAGPGRPGRAVTMG
jgi:hypothetical protein